jgi:hypothetical protein
MRHQGPRDKTSYIITLFFEMKSPSHVAFLPLFWPLRCLVFPFRTTDSLLDCLVYRSAKQLQQPAIDYISRSLLTLGERDLLDDTSSSSALYDSPNLLKRLYQLQSSNHVPEQHQHPFSNIKPSQLSPRVESPQQLDYSPQPRHTPVFAILGFTGP